MSNIDPYSTLGVGKDSSDAEIKRAWRKLARQYHPDRNPGDSAAEERFKRIQEAGDMIGSAETRKKYDEESQMKNMFGGGGNPFAGGNPFGGGGGGIEDMIGQMFGGGGARPRQAQQAPREPQKGKDLTIHLDLTMEEALEGGKRPVSFTRLTRGHIGNMTRESKKVNVNIPAKAKNGLSIRLREMGHEHPEGGQVGDAHLIIRIDPGEGRRWENDSLIQTVEVAYSMLLLGGKVKISTPSGKSGNLTIKTDSRIGDRRRMAGMGYDGGHLDLELVLLENDDLSKTQIKALESLKDSGL
jgi:DnaJ-class molecular chaperone